MLMNEKYQPSLRSGSLLKPVMEGSSPYAREGAEGSADSLYVIYLIVCAKDSCMIEDGVRRSSYVRLGLDVWERTPESKRLVGAVFRLDYMDGHGVVHILGRDWVDFLQKELCREDNALLEELGESTR